MTVTNKTKNDWTIGFRIPAGATVTMDVKKHIALAKNCQAFLAARARGDLDLQGDAPLATEEAPKEETSAVEAPRLASSKKASPKVK